MFATIPFGIDGRVAQAKVRRHVDHLHPFGQLGDFAVRGRVRQAAKGDVDLAPSHLIGGDEGGRSRVAKCGKLAPAVCPA